METLLYNKISQEELIEYLKDTILEICDRVRNKMVLPYSTLEQVINEEPLPRQIVELSIEDINWICHKFLPEVYSDVESKTTGGKLWKS